MQESSEDQLEKEFWTWWWSWMYPCERIINYRFSDYMFG